MNLYDSEALAAVETVGFREYNLTISIVLHDAQLHIVAT